MNQIDPIRRPKRAAEIMGVSVATYYRLVKTGKLKHIKISPRTSGTPQSSIDELLKNGAQ